MRRGFGTIAAGCIKEITYDTHSNPGHARAPRLPQAIGNGISALASAHLQVDISPYPSMEEGDLIELFWNNCFAASRKVTACKIGTYTHLCVPESFVQDGPARVHYQVLQIGHGPMRSAVTLVRVKTNYPGGQPLPRLNPEGGDENQNLAPVNLPETIRRHGVNSSQVRRGIPLTIEPYLNMSTGDAITLRWGDVRLTCPASRLRASAWRCRCGCRPRDYRSRRRPPIGGHLLHSRPRG